MARFDDVTAEAPVGEAEIYRLLGHGGKPENFAERAIARPVAVWEMCPQSNRPVCSWVMQG